MGRQTVTFLGFHLRPPRCSHLILLAVILMASLPTSSTAHAQKEKYAKEEQVEVFFLNEWRPGMVLDTNRKGEVLVAYEFGNSTQQRVFPQQQIRHAYESGAIARGRNWTDKTGQYKIKAALMKVSGSKVMLRSSDMKEIELSVDKLCEADQRFLENFKKEAGVAAIPVAQRPELSTFDTRNSSAVDMRPATGSRRRPPGEAVPDAELQLTADPVRSSLQLSQAGIAFPKVDFHDSMGTLLPLGGKDNWMLASIENNFGSEGLPVRLLWGALAKEKIDKIQLIPPGEVVLDYLPQSQLLLTKFEPLASIGEGSLFTIWRVGPSSDEPEGLVSWRATVDDKGMRNADVWARFVSNTMLLQRDSSHRLIAWDLKNRRVAWSMPQESFFAPSPVMSPGGAYLFVPEDNGLRILEPASGAELGMIPTSHSCSAVAPHPDGRRVAVLTKQKLIVVDITGADKQLNLDAAGIGTPFSRKIEWVNDDLIAVELDFMHTVLFSLKLQLPVWNYRFDSDAYSADARSGRTRSIVDGHLAYAASFNNAGSSGLVIGAVELPEPAVRDKIASIRRQDFIIFGPGDSIRIDASGTDDPQRVQAALEQKAKDNGWSVSSSATVQLKAGMKRGDTQTVQYEMQSLRGGASSTQSVTVTPYISTLSMTIDGKEAWSSATSSGVPPFLTLTDGESLQSEVDRWQQPDVGFFERVEIPAEVIDPKKTRGVGASAVTNRGLVSEL